MRQDGTSGQLDVLFYIQGVGIFRPAYGTLDIVSAAIGPKQAGTSSGTSTTTYDIRRAVTQAAIASQVATLTSTAHGFSIGDNVTIALSDTDYNGDATITAVTTNTFSFDLNNTDRSASVTGTAVRAVDAFPTSNGGLVECWVRFYNSAGGFYAARRITSNTAYVLTWVNTSTLPQYTAGNITVAASMTYEIGNVGWRWETRTFEIPGRKNHVFAGHITMDVVDSTKSVLKRDIVDGTVTPAASAAPHTYTASERAVKTQADRAGRDYAQRLESRNGAIIRHVEIDGIAESDTQ